MDLLNDLDATKYNSADALLKRGTSNALKTWW